MADLVIDTCGLRKEFGPKVAVADLTLGVRRGEVFGFLGPNGAGKTTSVKMLLGLVTPSAGQGQVLDAPLGDVPTRARIGFLPEHFRFQDWLTGREFLRFHGELFGLRGAGLETRIEALLSRVDLVDAGMRRLRDYSKGMQQRIGLAQALLNAPALVFLDEPTSGLDPLGRILVRDLILELKERGAAVFLNSHLLGEVEAICDRVAFVKRGVVLRELDLHAPDTRALTVELTLGGATPDLLRGLTQFGALARDSARAIDSGRTRLCLRVEDAARVPELTRWLVGQGCDVHGVRTQTPSLEMLFLEMMGADERPG